MITSQILYHATFRHQRICYSCRNLSTYLVSNNHFKGTYYNHIKRNKRGNTLHAKKKLELTPIIEEIFHSSNQTYGAARVHAVLKDRGYQISQTTVAKIMQENGWFSIRGGAKKIHEANKSKNCTGETTARNVI